MFDVSETVNIILVDQPTSDLCALLAKVEGSNIAINNESVVDGAGWTKYGPTASVSVAQAIKSQFSSMEECINLSRIIGIIADEVSVECAEKWETKSIPDQTE